MTETQNTESLEQQAKKNEIAMRWGRALSDILSAKTLEEARAIARDALESPPHQQGT